MISASGWVLFGHSCPHQFVAFYDADRRLTVAQRKLDQSRWSLTVLPVTTGWDSHNYVTMALDAEGFLHLSGNMHSSALPELKMAEMLGIRYCNTAGAEEKKSLRSANT